MITWKKKQKGEDTCASGHTADGRESLSASRVCLAGH